MITHSRNLEYGEQARRTILPKEVVLSSTSPRRQAFIRHMFGETVPVSSFCSAGTEPDTSDVVAVADFKVNRYLEDTAEQGVRQDMYGALIVAGDTRTIIPYSDKEGNIREVSKGKPGTIDELRENFRMILSVTKHGENPFYSVNSGAVGHMVGHDLRSEAFEICRMGLDEGAMHDLVTDEGMLRYLEMFQAFYANPPYSTNNMPPITPLDLSSGISLPVLAKMGIVTSINGEPRESNQFITEFENAMQIVAVGIPPGLFSYYHEDPLTAHKKWPWLNEVVQHALDY